MILKPTHPRFQDLTGKRFHRLTVLSYAGKQRITMWRCRCDCGTIKDVPAARLKAGKTKSCGCYRKERRHLCGTTHGMSGTSVYRTWCGMLKRCNKSNYAEYHLYGGRGIKVCPRWLHFKQFYADMGDRPAGHSIDRIDVDGNYSPENCRWATPKEQGRNTRRNLYYVIDGERLTLAEWCERFAASYAMVYTRIHVYGWSFEDALREPPIIRPILTDAARRQNRAARKAVGYALKTGKLNRPAVCGVRGCRGTENIQAHHHNGYSPEHKLDVVWLCITCHAYARRTTCQ